MNRVAVIGAGAAGIIAAWRAATLGANVVLFEKTGRLGTKILISGGGKCNITHDGPLEDVLRAFRPNEARFIRPACYRFRPEHIVTMLTDRGLEVYTRPDGRIFPVHQTAKDVVRILASYLGDEGVEVRMDCPVRELLAVGGSMRGVCTDAGDEFFDHVVLCVGGSSYPNSGTTGDGWPWTEQLGHRTIKVIAALAPMVTDPAPPEGYPGVAVRDCVLKARCSGKEIARWRGDTLFTHHGVSGPTALGVSREVAERYRGEPCLLELDLRPDHTFEELTAGFLELTTSKKRREVQTVLEEFVPSKLIPDLLRQSDTRPGTPMSQLQKWQRNKLIENLKAFQIGQVRDVVLPKGEVVAGGVSLDEVDPHTMRSLKINGLYLAGEVLDIAGPVGGYNLQAAFATGFVAGESAACAAMDASRSS